jgi:uracil-DNA glycosylase
MQSIIQIHPSWKAFLKPEFEKEYFKNLTEFVKEEYDNGTVYPEQKNIFRAFEVCPLDEVKVVILGQDPYHGAGLANGLCFSVEHGVGIPPSLKNIYKELQADLGVEPPMHGDLSAWGKQGVLLLNATLSVRAGQAASHQKKGWEDFTDAVIEKLSEAKENLVFILWGSYAQNKGAHIDRSKHLLIESAHPSPLAAYRGFFNSKPFSRSNEYLAAKGLKLIDWSL